MLCPLNGFLLLFLLICITLLHATIHFGDNLVALFSFLLFMVYCLWYEYWKNAHERASRPLKYKELLALPLFIYAITYYFVFQESMNRLIVRICKDIFW